MAVAHPIEPMPRRVIKMDDNIKHCGDESDGESYTFYVDSPMCPYGKMRQTMQHRVESLINRDTGNIASGQTKKRDADSGISVGPSATLPVGGYLPAAHHHEEKTRSLSDPIKPCLAKQHRQMISALKKKGQILAKVRVLTDYVPSAYQVEMLKIQRGDVIYVVEKNMKGTWTGVLNGRRGDFKFCHVEDITAEGTDTSDDSDSDSSQGIDTIIPAIAHDEPSLNPLELSGDSVLLSEKGLRNSDNVLCTSNSPESRPPPVPPRTQRDSNIYGNAELMSSPNSIPQSSSSEDEYDHEYESFTPGAQIPGATSEQRASKVSAVSVSPGDAEPQSVQQLLAGVNLQHLTKILEVNGFETVESLTFLSEEMLGFLDINNPETKAKLMRLKEEVGSKL